MTPQKVLSSLVGTSGLAIAASVLIVGTVWAGSAALREDPTSTAAASTTLAPDNTDGSSSTTTTSESVAETPKSLDDVITVVAEIRDDLAQLAADVKENRADADAGFATTNKRIDGLTDDVSTIVGDLRAATTRLESVAGDAKQAKAAAAEVRNLVDALTTRLAVVETKTGKLTDAGDYTGPIAPSQLTRRLTPADINGDWPLDRVTGLLSSQDIEVDASGCWPDSRYNTVMGVDPFRRITCLRLPK